MKFNGKAGVSNCCRNEIRWRNRKPRPGSSSKLPLTTRECQDSGQLNPAWTLLRIFKCKAIHHSKDSTFQINFRPWTLSCRCLQPIKRRISICQASAITSTLQVVLVKTLTVVEMRKGQVTKIFATNPFRTGILGAIHRIITAPDRCFRAWNGRNLKKERTKNNTRPGSGQNQVQWPIVA